MAIGIIAICTIVGIILCIFSARTRSKIKINLTCLFVGIFALFVAYLGYSYTYSMQLDIAKREMFEVEKEEIFYELITIEANDDDTEFHFYYRTEVDGVEGMKLHKISSENVFIVESNQCKPMVIENITVYEYDLSDFERRWLSAQYLETLQPQIHQYYEIYVPEGTFVRKYNLT